MNTGPLNLLTNTISEKALSDKIFVQRKLLFDEQYIEREKENADLGKTLVRQTFFRGFVHYFILQPWVGFLDTKSTI